MIREFTNQCEAGFAFEIYVTREFFLSFHGNPKISLKSCTREEIFEVFPFMNVTRKFLYISCVKGIRKHVNENRLLIKRKKQFTFPS